MSTPKNTNASQAKSGENSGPDKMKQAMEDALASVERIAQERKQSDSAEIETEIDMDVEEQEAAADENVATVIDMDGGDAGQQDDSGGGDAEAAPSADAQVLDLKDQLLRLAADFENFRKRARREREDARHFGIENLLNDLLPVIDNLDRALEHTEEDDSPMVQGVRMTSKQLVDALGTHQVKGFESHGEVFNPERHEAMSQIATADSAAGTVIQVLEKGYMLRDRLLRPAKVIVAVAPPEPVPQEAIADDVDAEGASGETDEPKDPEA